MNTGGKVGDLENPKNVEMTIKHGVHKHATLFIYKSCSINSYQSTHEHDKRWCQ